MNDTVKNRIPERRILRTKHRKLKLKKLDTIF